MSLFLGREGRWREGDAQVSCAATTKRCSDPRTTRCEPVARALLNELRKSKLDDQPKQTSERVGRLRKDVEAELAEEVKHRQRAEADTREGQAALEIKAEGGRADKAQADSLEETKNISLVEGGMERERNGLVSTPCQGASGRQPFLRQEG